jgi:Rad3-related DNA helicase
MDGDNLKIDLICLDATKVFEELKKDQPYNFILTSGTLSPLNLWELELGIKFPNPTALPNNI